ncbi:MAG: fluoride efflux transporter CrcB [Maricaulaceae bacterium]
MNGILYVALGGAIGASARHLLSGAAFRMAGPGFPVGTLAANVIGSFAMGVLVVWLTLKVDGGANLRLFLGVGLLGGFTTFSAFSLDAMLMFEKKAYGVFAAYVGSSVILSLLALAAGLLLARRVFAL